MDSTQLLADMQSAWDSLSAPKTDRTLWIPESLLTWPTLVEEIKQTGVNEGYSVCTYNLWGPAR